MTSEIDLSKQHKFQIYNKSKDSADAQKIYEIQGTLDLENFLITLDDGEVFNISYSFFSLNEPDYDKKPMWLIQFDQEVWYKAYHHKSKSTYYVVDQGDQWKAHGVDKLVPKDLLLVEDTSKKLIRCQKVVINDGQVIKSFQFYQSTPKYLKRINHDGQMIQYKKKDKSFNINIPIGYKDLSEDETLFIYLAS